MMSVISEEPRIPAAEEIDELRQEIDHLDAEILRLVKRRSEVSRLIGAARMAAGGPRIVYNRETAAAAAGPRAPGGPLSSAHVRCREVSERGVGCV
jgi:monofunctional chorismate mutase